MNPWHFHQAVVTVRRFKNCNIQDKYCGATILSNYWILSSAECFNIDENYDEELDYYCPRDIFVATKVDAIPPDTDIVTHEIEKVLLGNNSISVFSENIALIKLKKPIDFDESQRPVLLAKPTDKPGDKNCLELTGFKLNKKIETENLGSAFISITNSCYDKFPEIINDCFCTTEYNYYVNENYSHFLPGTSVMFNNKLVGFDPNSVTFTNLSNNITYAIFINTADMYDWIIKTIKN
ncbi:serine protease 55-like isoform X2 [Leptopilina boulardi]|uniref:serine protease 55-like isoform X2 n=1 Tax=Leptopilina boulardi TaxID=63433 RepID=UPI0021F5850F|nr:serine protease 55-like isoform X2 [Leptopilina boulardi]